MKLFFYSIAWWFATPLVMVYLLWRSRRQPEYRQHWLERWAFAPAPHIDGPLIWVHAVSVGETRAAQPLVNALLQRDPALTVLLTHMTPTGRQTGEELFAKRHGARLIQRYLPYDYADAMRRFLRTWRPQLGIVLETELWPNVAEASRALGVPLALVNARLSEQSLQKGLRWKALMAPAIESLSLVVAQTEADAARIRLLGRSQVQVAGNMKFDINPPLPVLDRGRAWRKSLGGRPVVLAASTRDGEEALLLAAWRQMQSDTAPEPRPVLVIVPRHPQRFDEVAGEIQAQGFSMLRRSAIAAHLLSEAVVADDEHSAADLSENKYASPLAFIDVLLGDSMGEMFCYYGMADVAIIGGSLLPFGAQNLIEACAAGVPVVLGPHTYNFADAAEQAILVGAGIRVNDADEALRVSLDLITKPDLLQRMSYFCLEFSRAHRGASNRTIEFLEPYLGSRLNRALTLHTRRDTLD